jgi:nicotinamide mononucleotide transporter
VTEALREVLRRGLEQGLGTGPVESLAVLAGIAYVLLAIRQKRACWAFGGLSTALYVLVFLDARLYLQSALQVVYVLLAIQGWRAWGGEAAAAPGLTVRRLGASAHLAVLAAALVLTAATAPALAHWSDSAAPWADALGTWASVAATWLMIRKVAANWLWWIVVDAGLAALFARQGLVFTAVLYAAFAVLAVAGWVAWRRAAPVH